MTIEAGGRELTVTGITRRERDTEAYEKSYGDMPRMYMSYYGYEVIYGEKSNITTLEMALPNPVKGFGMNIFQTAVQVQEDGMIVRENAIRYTLGNRLERMKELPFMGMRNNRVIYPYFENELQVMDYYTSLWMVFQTVVGMASLLCLLVAIISLFASGFSVTGMVRVAVQYLHAKAKKRKREHISRKRAKNS